MTKDRNLIASHEYDRIYYGREGMLRVTGDVNCDAMLAEIQSRTCGDFALL